MTTLTLENEPLAADVTVTESALKVSLEDGREISVPLAWYPKASRCNAGAARQLAIDRAR
jgi:hypothetical protein